MDIWSSFGVVHIPGDGFALCILIGHSIECIFKTFSMTQYPHVSSRKEIFIYITFMGESSRLETLPVPASTAIINKLKTHKSALLHSWHRRRLSRDWGWRDGITRGRGDGISVQLTIPTKRDGRVVHRAFWCRRGEREHTRASRE